MNSAWMRFTQADPLSAKKKFQVNQAAVDAGKLAQANLDACEANLSFGFHEAALCQVTVHQARNLSQAGILVSRDHFYVSGRITAFKPVQEDTPQPLKYLRDNKPEARVVKFMSTSTRESVEKAPRWEESFVLRGTAFPPDAHLHLVVFAEMGLVQADSPVGHWAGTNFVRRPRSATR